MLFEPLLAGTSSWETTVCDEVPIRAARVMRKAVRTCTVACVAVLARAARPVGGPVLSCVDRPDGEISILSGVPWTIWVETDLVCPCLATAFPFAAAARALVGRLCASRPVGLGIPSGGLPASADFAGAPSFELWAAIQRSAPMRGRRLQRVYGLEVERTGLSGVLGCIAESPRHLVHLLSRVRFELVGC